MNRCANACHHILPVILPTAFGPLFDFGYFSLDWAYDSPETNIMEAEATLILSGAYLGFMPEHHASAWVAAGKMEARWSRQILGHDAPRASRFWTVHS